MQLSVSILAQTCLGRTTLTVRLFVVSKLVVSLIEVSFLSDRQGTTRKPDNDTVFPEREFENLIFKAVSPEGSLNVESV